MAYRMAPVPENFGQFLSSEIDNRVLPYAEQQRNLRLQQSILADKAAAANQTNQWRMGVAGEQQRHNQAMEQNAANAGERTEIANNNTNQYRMSSLAARQEHYKQIQGIAKRHYTEYHPKNAWEVIDYLTHPTEGAKRMQAWGMSDQDLKDLRHHAIFGNGLDLSQLGAGPDVGAQDNAQNLPNPLEMSDDEIEAELKALSGDDSGE